jgi:hypothetical protein
VVVEGQAVEGQAAPWRAQAGAAWLDLVVVRDDRVA